MKNILSTALFLTTALACTSQTSLSAKNTPETRKGIVKITTLAKTSSDLPLCDQTSSGVQSFVVEVDRYMICDGDRWRSMSPGSMSGRFAARDPIRFYEWEDRIEKKRWKTPLEKPIAAALAESACEGVWQLPDPAELRKAREHGLFEEIKSHGGRAFSRAWTNETKDGKRTSEPLLDNAPDQENEAGIYCVGNSQQAG